MARQAQTLAPLALLEVVGTGPARKTLEAIAREGREEWLAKEAEAALKRLAEPKAGIRVEDLTGTHQGAAARAFLVLNQAGGEGNAEPAQIQAVLQLANQVPPLILRSRGITTRQLPHELLPYRKEVLDRYKADAKQTPFRAAVEDGIKKLQQSERDFTINETFGIMAELELMQEKRRIEALQKDKVGDAYFQLGKAAEELEELKAEKAKESKYWQATYDYVLASLYARQACVLEYNVMLGRIRRDDLPGMDLDRHKGWRLKHKEKLSDRDALEVADKAKALLKQLSKDHKGTPWEVIARQDSNSPFGLMWVPLPK